jgi:branched-chain amino acid transport system substrate-binding protein
MTTEWICAGIRTAARRRITITSAAVILTIGVPIAAHAQAPLPLKICAIDDRSGAAADTGIESLNAMQMVFEPLNAAGGINGKKIEVIAYDGKTDPQLTATFATRCVEDDKGLLIVGGSPTAPAVAMIPVAEQFKVPYYILSASSVNMKDAKYHFRFGPDGSQDGLAVADAFAEIGFKKVAIINNSTPFGTETAKNTIKALEAKGVKVVTQQTYDAAATDVAPQVINLRQEEPDVILVFPYPADGARVARTIRQLGLKQPIIMPRVGIMAAFLKLAGEAADGVLVPTSVDVTRPDVAKLYADYNAKYKPIAPSPSPAQGWDAAQLIVKVLSSADVQKAITGGNLAEAREAIRVATEKVGKFPGMQGQKDVGYEFSATRHHGPPDAKFFVFTEVAEKGTKLVTPDLAKIKPKN